MTQIAMLPLNLRHRMSYLLLPSKSRWPTIDQFRRHDPAPGLRRRPAVHQPRRLTIRRRAARECRSSYPR